MNIKEFYRIGESGKVDSFSLGRIHLTYSGRDQLSAIAGYLTALRDLEHRHATKFAEDFLKTWNYLSNYGGDEIVEHPNVHDIKFPMYRIRLSSDISLFSFSILWFSIQTMENYERAYEKSGKHIEDFRREGNYLEPEYYGQFMQDRSEWDQEKQISLNRYCEERQYRLSMNGGLIFHGRDEFLTDDYPTNYNYWSIHT